MGLRDGRTAEFAEFLNRTSSQVEHMAKAYHGYRLARPYCRIRKELSPSHFAALWTTWKHIEFDPAQCADYLEEAVENRFNSDQLREFIEIDNNVQPNPPNVKGWFDKGWEIIERLHENQEEALSLFRALSELIQKG